MNTKYKKFVLALYRKFQQMVTWRNQLYKLRLLMEPVLVLQVQQFRLFWSKNGAQRQAFINSKYIWSIRFTGLKAAKAPEFYQINKQLTEEQVIERVTTVLRSLCA
jgi:hypothetical protein